MTFGRNKWKISCYLLEDLIPKPPYHSNDYICFSFINFLLSWRKKIFLFLANMSFTVVIKKYAITFENFACQIIGVCIKKLSNNIGVRFENKSANRNLSDSFCDVYKNLRHWHFFDFSFRNRSNYPFCI